MPSIPSHRSAPAPINLATLDSAPSWVNLAGRVDRSACLEIKASHLWRRCEFDRARTAPRVSASAVKRGRPRAATAREAVATITLHAADVALLLSRQRPRRLSGDWRTAKANAMKRARTPQGRGLPRRHPAHGGRQKQFTLDHNLESNPNAGASRCKVLGIGEEESAKGQGPGAKERTTPIRHPQSLPWSQTITIERWRQHAKLAQHFLVCPCCRQKASKLYMPLCTTDELRDARLAQQWLTWNQKRQEAGSGSRIGDEHHRNAVPPPAPAAADCRLPLPTASPSFPHRLLARYAILFHPRRFLCRHCLGLRYGTGNRHQRVRSMGLYALQALARRAAALFTRMRNVRELHDTYTARIAALTARLEKARKKKEEKQARRAMQQILTEANRHLVMLDREERGRCRRMKVTRTKLKEHAKAQAARQSRRTTRIKVNSQAS